MDWHASVSPLLHSLASHETKYEAGHILKTAAPKIFQSYNWAEVSGCSGSLWRCAWPQITSVKLSAACSSASANVSPAISSIDTSDFALFSSPQARFSATKWCMCLIPSTKMLLWSFPENCHIYTKVHFGVMLDLCYCDGHHCLVVSIKHWESDKLFSHPVSENPATQQREQNTTVTLPFKKRVMTILFFIFGFKNPFVI